MLGGIGKMRPCGHHHYYKYAHAINHDDLLNVSREINKDDVNGDWNYSLDNIKTINKARIFASDKLKTFTAYTPNLEVINTPFEDWNYTTKLDTININWDKVTSCTSAFNSIDLLQIPDNFTPITRNFNKLFCVGFYRIMKNNNYIFPFNEVINEAVNGNNMFSHAAHMFSRVENGATIYEIWLDDRYTFENLKYGRQFMWNTWPYGYSSIRTTPKNLNLKSLEDGTAFFDGCYLQHFNSKEGLPNLRTGNEFFEHCPLETFCEGVNNPLPSLSTGSSMFNSARLNKETAIRILNSIPSYTSGSHPLTIGIHIDYKYDSELNIILKKVCNSYITPIEELGFSLNEEITTDKGWTLNVKWNGTATENAIPAPSE